LVATARKSAVSTQELVKISELARRSGVPSATIKHYLREGLLPPPVRTSRNMAYYDAGLVDRVRSIKELQRTFLPLRVIKGVLDGQALPAGVSVDATIEDSIQRALRSADAPESRTRSELLASGMPARQLDWMRDAGAVTPVAGAEEETYTGEDLELLRTLGAARRSGLTPAMLPVQTLVPYLDAIRELVRVELQLFREGVLPHAEHDLPRLTEAATHLSERLVVLLRRRLLVPTLRGLIEETMTSSSTQPRRSRSSRPKAAE
jgi:DNA-binding transcriptional MerR regulator